MNPHPADVPVRQHQTAFPSSPRWQMLSARDRVLTEDAWIGSVMDPDARARWESFLNAPRFVFSEDFAEWSVIVVSLQINESDNALLSLLFKMGAEHQTPVWAVCRHSKQIYRLPRVTLPARSPFANPDLLSPARSIASEQRFKPFVTNRDWADDAVRRLWEARLADRSEFELSKCSRPFYQAQQPGEFASLRDGDLARDVTELLDNVVAIEARSPRERRQLWQRLHRRERQLMRRVMQLISEHLDSVILHQVRSLGLKDGLSAQRLNWLSQVPAGEVRARRFQALVAAPLLLPMLIRINTDPVTAEVESNMASIMNVAIERGEPLFPLLAQQAGLTERTVRHLRTTALREHHLAAAHELHTAQRRIALLSWLELIPIERWPQTLRQWKLWVRVTISLLRQVKNVSQLLGDDPRSDAPVADVDPGADTLDFHANALRVAITHPFYIDLASRRWKLSLGPRHNFEWDREDGHAMDTVSFEMCDFIRSLQSGGLDHPDDMDEIGYVVPASVRLELRSWTITAWWAASDRWHQFLVDAGAHVTTRVSKFSDDGEVLHWLPLSQLSDTLTEAEGETEKATLNRMSSLTHFDFIKPEFRRIEFLSNSRALLEEGSAMDHCVSARVDDCLVGRTHIASVTDRQGRRCSTLAVRLDYVAGGWHPVLTEHRTVRNRAPNEASVVAVEQLMGKLRQPAWQAQYVLIEAARAERETALRARLPKLRNRAASLHLAALQAALPVALFLQISGDGH